jgi:hypothetical protein
MAAMIHHDSLVAAGIIYCSRDESSSGFSLWLWILIHRLPWILPDLNLLFGILPSC